MLVLIRKIGESLIINKNISVKSIKAPKQILIDREEVHKKRHSN